MISYRVSVMDVQTGRKWHSWPGWLVTSGAQMKVTLLGLMFWRWENYENEEVGRGCTWMCEFNGFLPCSQATSLKNVHSFIYIHSQQPERERERQRDRERERETERQRERQRQRETETERVTWAETTWAKDSLALDRRPDWHWEVDKSLFPALILSLEADCSQNTN